METRWLARIVGLVIAAASLGAGVLLWLTVAADVPVDTPTPVEEQVLGGFTILYAQVRPPSRVFWGAVGLALLAFAVVSGVEWLWARRSRRSLDARVVPLSPAVVMAATRGGFDGPVTVTVLIPAHDEEAALPVTVPALLSQSRPPDRVLVVADNCRDSTVAVAQRLGVDVFETSGNDKKKAGALNQALVGLLPTLGANDVVMVMDADTSLDDGFIEAAVQRFTADRALMAVGGIFYGEQGHALLGQFQRNEYTRYSRTIGRRRGRVFVLTGTSSLFRPLALRTVAGERGRSIPGTPGEVYDTTTWTEDNELTLALKSLGALMVSPSECTVVTELMPTWHDLWRQRMRWQRGALENIGAYGITPALFRYWGQQFSLGYGVLALYSYMAVMALLVVSVDTWVWFPYWLGIGALFVLERVVTVWRGGWRARLLALTLFPELCYDLFLDTVFVKSIFDITFARAGSWGHVQHSPTGTSAVAAAVPHAVTPGPGLAHSVERPS